MWSVFKYVVDHPDDKDQDPSKPEDEVRVDVRLENTLETIKAEIDKNAENYIISLHYLEFPIIMYYGNHNLKDTPHLKKMSEYIEMYKEARKILLMNKEDEVRGFYFLRNQIRVQKEILNSLDQETFDKRASESGLEAYIVNDLRIIWKNKRLEQLQRALAHHVDKYYRPDPEHPLYTTFVKYLESIYRRGVDRFKTFICIGSTFIGKSVFFGKFLVPEQYYVYHSNFLEYSKMPNQPQKIFRILDDINWEQVTSTELKSLMNRNISSVNIKYGYEYIFPLIPVIIMNGEDYKAFRQHFADIWEFVERNTVIYPPQEGREVREETVSLFTSDEADFEDSSCYLFSQIMDVKKLTECNLPNMNEWIKKVLNKTESWKYDTKRYIQLPVRENMKIPNPELSRKNILKQYEEFILQKKVKEMNTPEEKKPREPWYKMYKTSEKKPARARFDDITFSDDDDEKSYDGKKYKSSSEESFDSEDSMSEGDESGSEETSSVEEDCNFKKGFIQI